MPFTDQLRQAADPIWAAQHEHPFIRGIGDGSLEPARFRHYVRQDYLFLIDYARLLALGCARAPRLDEMTRFARLADSVLGSEMELHRSYAAAWGISAAALECERPTATTSAYTNFLLRVAALGNYGELVAALLPCMWGYHELATRLAERSRPSNELYARWIDEYASTAFGELAT
jgi:thiaminase/transcriptional activator TenA